MSSIHTIFAMRALPVATAGGVVGRVRGGHLGIPLPSRCADLGTAGMAFT